MDILFIILAFLAIVVAIIAFSYIPALVFVYKLIRAYPTAKNPKKVTMQDVDKMDGTDFEHWCADLLRKNGFSQVEVVGKSNDQGVDITAYKDEKKYAIQCKRYNHKLSNAPIQQVHTGKTIHNCDVAMVITNNYFTAGAIKAAKATGVILWDRKKLEEMLGA